MTVQIIKGWLDASGKTHEKVYDVVWADADRRQPRAGGKLPAGGQHGGCGQRHLDQYYRRPGADHRVEGPDFDPTQRAFYYARVIEIPTPRWTAYDAKRFGVRMPDQAKMTTQERAYTSPIWYTPGNSHSPFLFMRSEGTRSETNRAAG